MITSVIIRLCTLLAILLWNLLALPAYIYLVLSATPRQVWVEYKTVYYGLDELPPNLMADVCDWWPNGLQRFIVILTSPLDMRPVNPLPLNDLPVLKITIASLIFWSWFWIWVVLGLGDYVYLKLIEVAQPLVQMMMGV